MIKNYKGLTLALVVAVTLTQGDASARTRIQRAKVSRISAAKKRKVSRGSQAITRQKRGNRLKTQGRHRGLSTSQQFVVRAVRNRMQGGSQINRSLQSRARITVQPQRRMVPASQPRTTERPQHLITVNNSYLNLSNQNHNEVVRPAQVHQHQNIPVYAPQEDAAGNDSSSAQCLVCFENRSELQGANRLRVLPCSNNHPDVSICLDCLGQLRDCPVCRGALHQH